MACSKRVIYLCLCTYQVYKSQQLRGEIMFWQFWCYVLLCSCSVDLETLRVHVFWKHESHVVLFLFFFLYSVHYILCHGILYIIISRMNVVHGYTTCVVQTFISFLLVVGEKLPKSKLHNCTTFNKLIHVIVSVSMMHGTIA